MKENNRIYYLLSGSDKVKGFYNSVKPFLQKDIVNGLTITFIASSFDNYDKNDLHYKNTIEFFNRLNINFSKTNLIDRRVDKQNAIDMINNADVLYLMGGNPYEKMESFKEYELVEPIKIFNGIIIGVSAGSMNMNVDVCYVEENNELLKYKGIGLTNFNIAPHYDEDNKEYLEEIKRVSMELRTIALPNESFIRVINNQYEIIGDYYIFDKGNIVEAK